MDNGHVQAERRRPEKLEWVRMALQRVGGAWPLQKLLLVLTVETCAGVEECC